MLYDLHTHTNCSDGSLAPDELLSLAAEGGVDVLAITDHDTAEAHLRPSLPALSGMEIITGIEWSTSWRGVGVHVLGLNVDVRHPAVRDGVAQQQAARVRRAETIAVRLEKAGAGDLLDAVVARSNGRVSRPHFAQELVERGVVKDVKTAFRRYLGAGKPGDVKQFWAPMADVCAWVRDAGGIAVLAHPDKYRLTRTRLKALVADFIACGGRGMEVVCGSQDPGVTARLGRLAVDSGLLASCGSDFHHPSQPWSRPGRFASLPSDTTPVWTAW